MAVKRYNGTSWDTVAGLGAQGAAATSSSITTWVKTASGGETSLTGSSDSSTTLAYTPGQEQVFINGVLQVRGSDYTATNGTSITGLAALTAGDIATVTTVNAFSVTGAVPLSTVTANGDLIVGTSSGAVGRLGIGSTNQVLKVSGGVPTWGAAPAASFVGASAYVSGSQSITASTLTTVDFANENFDTDAFHSTSSNTSRMTIPTGKAGKYLVTGTLGVDVTSNFYTRINVNGNAVNGSSYGYYNVTGTGDSNINRTQVSFGAILDLAVGDYVQLQVVHASSAARNLEAGRFDLAYLGA